jgi:hypothetical protein
LQEELIEIFLQKNLPWRAYVLHLRFNRSERLKLELRDPEESGEPQTEDF